MTKKWKSVSSRSKCGQNLYNQKEPGVVFMLCKGAGDIIRSHSAHFRYVCLLL